MFDLDEVPDLLQRLVPEDRQGSGEWGRRKGRDGGGRV